ncbi:transcriptional regulator [Caballeronia glathei]|jgi:LysR family glycine cleavage system transcriptional activator|uniref:Transcriptional regulator n=2 Tax=Caballeronia glathei TaxID=60547 RepID=A0A069PPV8_9BURK|nr:transcriptional regulator GcvA [Caballeronia glathei]KDR41919.1 transcriptional regulator [Caballeronia glathei]TCK36639.1 LysR family transcriptional regulator [Paraburkholderia sp. BL8N3]
MRRKLPPLNALRAFEASGRYSSFTGAAKELLVTQGAVSRHVSSLEDWLGVKLFLRTHRGIELTRKGEAYIRALSVAFDQIDYATREARDQTEGSVLRLKVPPTFAMRWLVPRLTRFQSMHPGIELQVTTSHEPANFRQEDVDVSVHSHPFPPVDSGQHRLFREVLMPVCSPNLLKREPGLRCPKDLARHALLSSRHRPMDWSRWLIEAGITELDSPGSIDFDNAALAYQGAIDDLGVVIAVRALIEDDLRTGRLVAPFDLQVSTPGGYYLACSQVSSKSPQLVAFEEWLVKEAEDYERWVQPATEPFPGGASATR